MKVTNMFGSAGIEAWHQSRYTHQQSVDNYIGEWVYRYIPIDIAAARTIAAASAGDYAPITDHWIDFRIHTNYTYGSTENSSSANIVYLDSVELYNTKVNGGNFLDVKHSLFNPIVFNPKEINVNGATILAGTGSPEGVISGGIGSVYLRKDGSHGNTLYKKESGTGTTGWLTNSTSVINVTDYGAIGDGVTDNSAAIQAAIDYAFSLSRNYQLVGVDYRDIAGSSIYIPCGTYVCNSSIEWKDGVKIFGDGKESTKLLFNTGVGVDGFYNNPTASGNYTRIVAERISFYGQLRNVRDILKINFAYVKFDDVDVQYSGRYGMALDACINSKFTRCLFGNSQDHNFLLTSNQTAATTIYFDACYFANSIDGVGVMVENVLNGVFNACIFESNGASLAVNDHCGWGAIVKKGTVSFYSPYMEDNYGGGLWLGQTRVNLGTGGNRFSVSDLTNINTNFKPTIRVDEATSIYIKGDYITNTASGGTYQFYPKYAFTYNIETSQDADYVKFYNQDTSVEIPLKEVNYLTGFKTQATSDSSYHNYLGSRTTVHAAKVQADIESVGSEDGVVLSRIDTPTINTYTSINNKVRNASDVELTYGEIRFYNNNVTAGSERGDVSFYSMSEGALQRTLRIAGNTTYSDVYNSGQYTLSALNTPPASSGATGTQGEIRFTSGYLYLCTATNTWVRSAFTSF